MTEILRLEVRLSRKALNDTEFCGSDASARSVEDGVRAALARKYPGVELDLDWKDLWADDGRTELAAEVEESKDDEEIGQELGVEDSVMLDVDQAWNDAVGEGDW